MNLTARAEKIFKDTGCKCEAAKYCNCIAIILDELQAAYEDGKSDERERSQIVVNSLRRIRDEIEFILRGLPT